jgi:predicted nucleic-acid-binding protein
MIAVDTNVLVRVLVDDPGERRQVRAARRRVRAASRVFIPQVVQAETVWVLQSAYRLDKETIISVLDRLANNRAYILQNDASFRAALAGFRDGSADFSDYLIRAESEAAGYLLVTFDKRLRESPGVEAV